MLRRYNVEHKTTQLVRGGGSRDSSKLLDRQYLLALNLTFDHLLLHR